MTTIPRSWRTALGCSVAILVLLVGCGQAIDIPAQPATGIVANYSRTVPISRTIIPPPIDGHLGNRRLEVYADGMVAIGGLPWFHQGQDRTCAQANIAALLNYWGYPTSYADVVAEMNPGNWPTVVSQVSRYFQKKGLPAASYRMATLNYVRWQLIKGRPTMVLLDYGSLATVHYVTVKGYNDTTRQVLVSDPFVGPNVLMPVDEFEAKWQNETLQRIPALRERYIRIAFDVAAPNALPPVLTEPVVSPASDSAAERETLSESATD